MPKIDTSQVVDFRANKACPPGVAVACTGTGDLIWLGPAQAMAVKCPELPPGSVVNLDPKTYELVTSTLRVKVPNAPTLEDQEFVGPHKHPKTGAEFLVCIASPDGGWAWKPINRVGGAIAAGVRTDMTSYPTAEGAYLAAIGE